MGSLVACIYSVILININISVRNKGQSCKCSVHTTIDWLHLMFFLHESFRIRLHKIHLAPVICPSVALNIVKSGGVDSIIEDTWLSKSRKSWLSVSEWKKAVSETMWQDYCITYRYFEHEVFPWQTCKHSRPDDFNNGTHAFDELVCIISSDPLFYHM